MHPNVEKPNWIVHNGIRHVDPYYFEYFTFIKERWVGWKILNLCVNEFKGEQESYYINSINYGRITVNNLKVTCDYVLKESLLKVNDFIKHKCHRHEYPIIESPITILRETKDIVVIDKPSSVPIHPCGRFNYNSITMRLENENNLKDLKVVHRLDRLTSGLLILAKTIGASQFFSQQIQNRNVCKFYLAKVRGLFPNGIVECNQSIKKVSSSFGLNVVSHDGKESSTTFLCLLQLSTINESIVLCKPKTGRTHQIRVHLQYLKHPISNDPLYSHACWDIPDVTHEKIISVLRNELSGTPYVLENQEELNKNGKRKSNETSEVKKSKRNSKVSEVFLSESVVLERSSYFKKEFIKETVKTIEELKQNKSENERNNSEIISLIDDAKENLYPMELLEQRIQNFDIDCSECKVLRNIPSHSELSIYLHAYRYKGKDWDYTSMIPAWIKSISKETIESAMNAIMET